ncbi:chorismate mutase [Streptomyces sp. SID8352]|uniref:chorismate mutase n=1 Tax=Streptomyces sp. SID8352 TaxID=2690338 RepID=UPI0013705646|nr:chorismate mutase [Streptomyces sp. SID8352]MYU25756.1 chorismate mutase [Streptomyces sp. SID8352]
MTVRAVRGAVQLDRDDRAHLVDSTKGLLKEILDANGLEQADLISLLFTATPDLSSEFPAVAARELGITDTPLLCARELDVAGSLPRVVRVLLHAETDRPKHEVRHVYRGGAARLRADLGAPLEETR